MTLYTEILHKIQEYQTIIIHRHKNPDYIAPVGYFSAVQDIKKISFVHPAVPDNFRFYEFPLFDFQIDILSDWFVNESRLIFP